MAFTLIQLTTFVRIAEFGSLSKAAASLRMAQPALSRQVRSLELDLGEPLLTRHAWGVTLTPAGTLLLEHAQRIIRETEAARSAVGGLSNEPSGALSIGAPSTFAVVILPQLAMRLRRLYPKLDLRLADAYSATLHEWALEGRLDLAVLYEDANLGPLPHTRLLSEDLVLVGAAGAFSNQVLSPADLLEQTLILPSRPNRLRLLVEAWVPAARVALDVDSLPALLEIVRLGGGSTVLPYSCVHQAVREGRLSTAQLRPALSRTLVLARPPQRPASFSSQGVEAVLRSLIAEGAAEFRWTPILPEPR